MGASIRIRHMVPTVLGRKLVEAFLMLDASLVRPALRASMETQVASIADGKAEARAVLAENLDLYRNKFRVFQSRFDKAFYLFDGSELRDAPTSRGVMGLESFMDETSRSRLLALQLQKQDDEEAVRRSKGQRQTEGRRQCEQAKKRTGTSSERNQKKQAKRKETTKLKSKKKTGALVAGKKTSD